MGSEFWMEGAQSVSGSRDQTTYVVVRLNHAPQPRITSVSRAVCAVIASKIVLGAHTPFFRITTIDGAGHAIVAKAVGDFIGATCFKPAQVNRACDPIVAKLICCMV